MINNWKLGWKYMHYAHSRISNMIAMAIFFVIGIAFLAMYAIDNTFTTFFLGGYMMLASAMMPTQMLQSLNVSNLVQASPAKKKLQTSVPAVVSCVNMIIIYLIIVLIMGITTTIHPESIAILCTETLFLAGSCIAMMIYMALAYKYFTVSIVMFLFIYSTLYMNSTMAEHFADVFPLTTLPAFPLTILAGIALIAAGGFLQYLVSLSVYKAPMSKMAQAASLRKEM